MLLFLARIVYYIWGALSLLLLLLLLLLMLLLRLLCLLCLLLLLCRLDVGRAAAVLRHPSACCPLLRHVQQEVWGAATLLSRCRAAQPQLLFVPQPLYGGSSGRAALLLAASWRHGGELVGGQRVDARRRLRLRCHLLSCGGQGRFVGAGKGQLVPGCRGGCCS